MILARFWEVPAAPKIEKNRPRRSESGFWDVSWTHLFSKVGLGRVLGGFWEEIWWIFKVADHFVDSYFALEFLLNLCGISSD